MQGIPGSPYGTPGAITCATCGVALSPGSTFCANCGAPVAQTPPTGGQPATYPPAGYPPAGYPPAGSLPSGAGSAWASDPSNPTYPPNPPTSPTLNPPRPASSSLAGSVPPQSPSGAWPTGPVPYPPPAPAQSAGWQGASMPGTEPGAMPGVTGGWQAPSTTPYGAPPAGGEWANTMPGMPGSTSSMGGMSGMAGLAGSPVAPPPAKPKSRRVLITTIAAVCVVALLGGGAYWAFATFLNPTHQLETARDVPSSTFAYASIDLVALGNNSHHYSFSNPSPATAQTENAATQSALGLNFTTDILPWLGRDISFAAWPGTASGGGGSSMEAAALVQSRDDSAADAAVTKALTHLGQQGQQYSTSTYGGFTLHSSGDAAGGVIATGSGEVIIASTVSAAHTVIDRINGQSDALSSNSAFQTATSNLPSDRYGTVYINFRALASATGSSASLPSAFLNIYPDAVSYLEWTQAGLRWQTVLKAAQSGAPAASLSGNANSLAAMVPQNASVFAGASNLGGLVQSFDALAGSSGGGDPLQSALGVASTDSTLQQGAAIAAFGGSSGSSVAASGAFLIHEASASDADKLLTALENQVNNASGQQTIQLVPTQVGSVSATNIESVDGTGLPFGLGSSSSTTTAPDGNFVIATEAYLNNTMVVATSTDALQSIINVSQGSAPSLAHSSGFSQLVSNAPSSPALTTYVDLASLEQSLGPTFGATGVSLPTASLFTLVWDSSQLQFTADVSLSQ